MSWHGPSAPRVEGIATKSAVVASCASKPASTASRIRCWVSAFTVVLSLRSGACPGSKHSSTDLVEGALPFRITDVPVQFAAATSRRGRMAENRVSDNRNVLYLIIGVLVVAVGVLGFNLYQAKKQPEGLQINV